VTTLKPVVPPTPSPVATTKNPTPLPVTTTTKSPAHTKGHWLGRKAAAGSEAAEIGAEAAAARTKAAGAKAAARAWMLYNRVRGGLAATGTAAGSNRRSMSEIVSDEASTAAASGDWASDATNRNSYTSSSYALLLLLASGSALLAAVMIGVFHSGTPNGFVSAVPNAGEAEEKAHA
jgi:hypothetical protein